MKFLKLGGVRGKTLKLMVKLVKTPTESDNDGYISPAVAQYMCADIKTKTQCAVWVGLWGTLSLHRGLLRGWVYGVH